MITNYDSPIDENLEKDMKNSNNNSYNICLYHHDQTGKRIKLIIPICEINENQNCLEYAIGSNKITFLDKIILKILNIFGL